MELVHGKKGNRLAPNETGPPMSEPRAKRGASRMEAAGVEPASERPVAAELYMRSRAFKFAAAVKVRRNRRPLARDVSPAPFGLRRRPAY